MKTKLLALLAAALMITAAGIGVFASPASAEGDAVTGCQLVQNGPGTSSCTFIGVGTIGTYQLTTELADATLNIDCNGWRRLHATANSSLTPGANAGNYFRPYLTNSCQAYLTLPWWASSLAQATATFS